MHCYSCLAHTFRFMLGGTEIKHGFLRKTHREQSALRSLSKNGFLLIRSIRHYFSMTSLAWSALEILRHNSVGSSTSLSKVSPFLKTSGIERLGLWLLCVYRSQLTSASLQGPLELDREMMKGIYEPVSDEAGWATSDWVWRPGYQSLFLWSLTRAVFPCTLLLWLLSSFSDNLFHICLMNRNLSTGRVVLNLFSWLSKFDGASFSPLGHYSNLRASSLWQELDSTVWDSHCCNSHSSLIFCISRSCPRENLAWPTW